jgi:predicted nucleotidyltransferase component of viral defense system
MPTRELKKQDNSRQYNFEFGYNSVITDKVETIKIELRSRDKSIVLPIEEHPVQHKFTDPFRNESLIDDGLVKTLSLKEVLADKLAAAINRAKPRDFYDIDYAIRNNFDFADKFFVEVFKKKLQDDNNETEISKYKDNLGLTSGAIDNIKYEIPLVLYPVLSIDEQRNFTIASALKRINIAMQQMIEIER